MAPRAAVRSSPDLPSYIPTHYAAGVGSRILSKYLAFLFMYFMFALVYNNLVSLLFLLLNPYIDVCIF
jgi:hypothetical protein